MTHTIYTDRSRIVAAQRCRRLRYLEYHAGPDGMGLQPRRKSVHLVVGGAVHAGVEVLLRDSQIELDRLAALNLDASLQDNLDFMFARMCRVDAGEAGVSLAREIEDRAVEAALKAFDEDFGTGVELDPEEMAAQAARQSNPLIQSAMAGGDSPIIIDFSDLGPTK